MFSRVATHAWLFVLLAGCSAGEPFQVTDARVREVIPGQDKTVGYFTAHNGGDADIVLVGAAGSAFRAVEMHSTTRDGDIVRMRRLPEVVIPAGETVRFEPGGRHLMLFGVEDVGTGAEIVLEAKDGRRFPVRFTTIALGADP